MKKQLSGLLLLFFWAGTLLAQSSASGRHKIALFAPLYLDSVFDGSAYRYGNSFPKFLYPGLEFYQGAQRALDSLAKAGAPLEVYIYDSRSKRAPMEQRLNSAELRDVEMLIGHANAAEVRTLADAALSRRIPFISATLPNDAGVTNNPYLVVLNSTLRTHCEGLYRYLQKYHPLDRIVLFRKNGVQEGLIRDYFAELARTSNGSPLKIDVVDIGSSFAAGQLTARLDSTKKNVCIAGSLDESFGISLASALASVNDTYNLTIVGMPTWDGIREFSKPEYKGLDILYSTPFYYNRVNSLQASLAAEFEDDINSRPTDMYFRGYETVLRFALLLLETKKDVASNLTKKGNTVFTFFDIQPVFLNKQNMTLDYFENKKLTFIKIINGVKTPVDR
ncbi:MAG TPA: ABC transporter substrate-binding protein [Chitinophagaceae bacterium]|jgi:ABC-type branched-subunit amino acid transport system substrate-binding protein|nr:ABC transporter substrate-binding protein [Chitinophagaceae bacterium]